MPIKPESVDQYLQSGCGRCELGGTPRCKVRSWTEELRSLREILRESGLTEQIKWSAPCYTHDGKNVLMLSALRGCVTLSFFRGAQMKDPEGILEKPGENSRIARYIRFKDARAISALKPTILDYIQEAVEIERSGKKVDAGRFGQPKIPPELAVILESNPDFRNAFDALTPGRQRGYLIHFSSAKQTKTRTRRIEKCMPGIFAGKGWNER